MNARRPEGFHLLTVHDLQHLDIVFQIDQGPGAELRVRGPASRLLPILLLAKRKDFPGLDQSCSVDVVVADSHHPRPQIPVAADRAHAHQGQPLVRVRRPARTVVATELLQAARERTILAVRTQLEVDRENALAFCFDQGECFLDKSLEKLRVLDTVRPRSSSVVAVNKQQFDVRGIAQRRPAELAEPENRDLCRQAGHTLGRTVPADKRLRRRPESTLHHRFGKNGKTSGKPFEVERRVENMVQIDQKNLTVLELVQYPLSLPRSSLLPHQLPQSPG